MKLKYDNSSININIKHKYLIIYIILIQNIQQYKKILILY